MFERGGDEMLAGDEHDDIVGRVVELALVAFRTQRLDMPAHRFCMQVEMPDAFTLVIGLERGLVGVQGNLGVDHQLLLARHMDHRIGAQAPFVGLDRMFENEIGVFGQAALFEHVLQRALAPAAARLGCVGQTVAEPLRLAPDLFLAQPHLFDLRCERGERIGALFLQRGDLVLVFLEPVAHRLQQFADLGFGGLLRMPQPLGRAFEKGILRLGQHRRTGVLEFLEHFLARFDQQALLLVEIGGLFLQRRKLGAERPVIAAHFLEHRLVLAARLAQFAVERVGPLGADRGIFQVDDRLAELRVEFLRLRITLAMAGLPVLDRRGAEAVTEEISQREAEDEHDDGNEGRIHGATLRRTERER